MSEDSRRGGKGSSQLELPIGARPAVREPAPAPITAAAPRGLRVIRGEGKRRDETLRDRNDVTRVLVGAAADLLLKRISPDRAQELARRVAKIMRLFDRVDDEPALMLLLRKELDDLEAIVREGREKHEARKR